MLKTIWKRQSLLVWGVVSICSALTLADDIAPGGFFSLNDRIVRVQSTSPLVVAYDDGQTVNIPSQMSLRAIASYSDLPTTVKQRLSITLRRANMKIGALEEGLKSQFDEAYLEMSVACLLANAGRSGDDIRGVLTEERSVSLQGLVAQCKEYEYANDLKVVLNQCKFYEKLFEHASTALGRQNRAAEREIVWLKSKTDVEGAEKYIAAIKEQNAIIKKCKENESYILAARSFIDKAKAECEAIGTQYFRVYRKTNAVFQAYTNLYNRLSGRRSLTGQRKSVSDLLDDWTRGFVRGSTLASLADAGSAWKELDARRNPVPPTVITSFTPPARERKRKTPTTSSQDGQGESSEEKPEKKKKKGCFVATAVYGSYEHPDVMVLRGFRDNFLADYGWGRSFISWYYDNGPGWAESVSHYPSIVWLVRFGLQCFVLLLMHPVWFAIVAVTVLYAFYRVLKRYHLKHLFHRLLSLRWIIRHHKTGEQS